MNESGSTWEAWVDSITLGEAGSVNCKCGAKFNRLDWADPTAALKDHAQAVHLEVNQE